MNLYLITVTFSDGYQLVRYGRGYNADDAAARIYGSGEDVPGLIMVVEEVQS